MIKKGGAIALIVAIVMSGLGTTMAYDADNPWTGTVLWSIPADTSFTVTFAGSQTQVNFTASSATETFLEPDGQDATNNTPILTIENTGNTALDFYINLTSSPPTWAELRGDATPNASNALLIGTSGFAIEVNPGNSTPLYLWTNITNATAGDTTRTLMISSIIA